MLRDADSVRLMMMTTRFHWRQLRKSGFFSDRATRPDKEIKKKKKRKKRIREIVICFPACRFPDVIDRKHFHFRLTLVRQLLARVRNFVEVTRLLSSLRKFTKIFREIYSSFHSLDVSLLLFIFRA